VSLAVQIGLYVLGNVAEVRTKLQALLRVVPTAEALATDVLGKSVDTYDHLLTPDLLVTEYASRAFDVPAAVEALEELLAN
jgi:hypothetical protein